MNKLRLIEIHLNSLAQLIPLGKENFPDIKIFNSYKKKQIYLQRNQYISEFLDIPIQNNQILKSELGKPYLAYFPDFSFNHSHSQNHYAIALSNSVKDIGIDIEDLNRKVRFDALAEHAFHPNELKRWNDLDRDSHYWFKVWTTKEAVLKASGFGIRINLNELDTNIHIEQDGGLCSHPAIGYFAFQNYQLPNVMMSVAWRSELSCKGFQFPQLQIFEH